MQRPVFGVGPDKFLRAGWEISQQARYGMPLKDQAPHNTFMQFWVELGTVGLVVVLMILGGGASSLLSLRARLPRQWIRGTWEQRVLYELSGYLPVCILGFSVSAFFVSHAYTGMFYILTAFTCAVLMLAKRELAIWRTVGIKP